MPPNRIQCPGRTCEILLESSSSLSVSFLPTPPHVRPPSLRARFNRFMCSSLYRGFILLERSFLFLPLFQFLTPFKWLSIFFLQLECPVFWQIQRVSFSKSFQRQLQSSTVTSVRLQSFAPLWPPPLSGQHARISVESSSTQQSVKANHCNYKAMCSLRRTSKHMTLGEFWWQTWPHHSYHESS